jgi:hypothetical protein
VAKSVTQAQLRTVRNQLADGISDGLGEIADAFHAGSMTLMEWAARFAAFIRHGTIAGWLLGSGGTNAVTNDALSRIDALIAKQTPFAEQIIRDLGQAQLSPEQTRARAKMYAGTAVTAYEQGMAYRNGIDLPTYPGMGDTTCYTNCRCSWRIETTDTEVMAFWDTAGDAKVCESCQSLSRKYNPLRVPR